MGSVLLLAACGDGEPGTRPDAGIPVFPERLSEAGLYSDFEARTVVAGAMEVSPTHVLWSDGAVKHRWLMLPEGTRIDTSDMDHWRFPVGTKLFKEFASPDGTRLETRLIWRVADTGDRETDMLMGSFVWLDDDSDAVFAPHGEENLRATDHDAPAADKCWKCHIGEPGQVLGVSAMQLAGSGAGVRLADLVDGERVSDPPAPGQVIGAPGDAETAKALGYLHANCGHCHNPNGGAWSNASMVLRLDVGEHVPEETALWQSVVGVPLQYWMDDVITMRVAPGDPAASAIIHRMGQRGVAEQMPPLATEFIDTAGIEQETAWIQSLAQ